VAIGANENVLAILDRRDLSLVVQAKVSDLVPACWATPDRLVLEGLACGAGVWQLDKQRLLWHEEDGVGAQLWQQTVATWQSESALEFRTLDKGKVERTVDVGFPARSYDTRCQDMLICDIEAGDSIRAVALADGRIVWQRPLVAELHAKRHNPDFSDPLLAVTSGSIPGHFIATYGDATYGCSLKDGSIRWSADVFVPYYRPLVENGLVPVLSAANTRVVIIDERTGALRCDRQHLELRGVYDQKSGSILGQLVVFVSESGHIAAFDLQTGDLVSLEHHKDIAFWGSAVADGRLLVSATDGNLWVFEGA
jgi:outer membrane protein assembly factor BamB